MMPSAVLGTVARRMKRTPTLTFHYDDGPERGVRLSRLLDDR